MSSSRKFSDRHAMLSELEKRQAEASHTGVTAAAKPSSQKEARVIGQTTTLSWTSRRN